MIRIISALMLAVAAASCGAGGQPLQLADSAPHRHIVLPGDTLWSIAGKFLKEPYRWPELWRLNGDQIKNPHRIFPGDIIVLDRDADGNPRLRTQNGKLAPQIYAEQLRQSIPSIPPELITPFLSVPLIAEANELDNAARIVATQQTRVFLGNGDIAYVTDADPAQQKWQIYRKTRPISDPDTKNVLGYEAYYLGTARQNEAGNPATFEIISAKEEISRGDRLMPSLPPPLINYVPHAPETQIDGRIVSVYGGVNEAGQWSTLLLNRGSNDGIEIGHVLALHRNRVLDQRDEDGRKETVRVPEERYGLLFVFRTFDRLSYALVMQSEGPVTVNDFVRTP
ncbi:MAG: LysM peptidoglycan-binding domain-containing protein [Betaproteobacteria bacterium]|nr:LysM peptidoglycan-binding domain-containing protein [Betaproteobacteria bacterium]